MDNQTLVFDISSDEEFGLDSSSSADNFDWISKLLDVDDDIGFPPDFSNGQNPTYDAVNYNHGGNDASKINNDIVNSISDDDDDVVVVGEVIAKQKRAKRSFHDTVGGGDDDDDDCVVLEFDPDKPPEKLADAAAVDDEVRKCGDCDDDEDDLVVVSEKGQVACRDFPHSRHLCANFPFSSTPHEIRCDQCHCYVCDSVAPCAYWGSGVSSTGHCNATDKVEYWQLERKRFRQTKNALPATAEHVASLSQLPPSPHPSARPDLLPRLAASRGMVSSFGAPNMGRNQRATVAVARDRFQPRLVSRQILKACNGDTTCTIGVHSAPRVSPLRAVCKRPGYSIRPGVANRSAYNPLNNASVAYLRPQSHQLAGKHPRNSSANQRHLSPQLVTSPLSCQSNTSCVSPGALPSLLKGHGLPSSQTPTSQFQGRGPSPSATSIQPHMYSSSYQTHSISGPIIPYTASSALNILSQNSQPISSVTQKISSPDIACSRPDVVTGVSQNSDHSPAMTQTYFCPAELSSIVAQNNVAQSSCQQPSAENSSFVDKMVPLHERTPSVEQDSQTSLDYGFDDWLQGMEPMSPSFDLNFQPSVTALVDPDPLFFCF